MVTPAVKPEQPRDKNVGKTLNNRTQSKWNLQKTQTHYKETRIRQGETEPCFSRVLRHPARKRIGPILGWQRSPLGTAKVENNTAYSLHIVGRSRAPSWRCPAVKDCTALRTGSNSAAWLTTAVVVSTRLSAGGTICQSQLALWTIRLTGSTGSRHAATCHRNRRQGAPLRPDCPPYFIPHFIRPTPHFIRLQTPVQKSITSSIALQPSFRSASISPAPLNPWWHHALI